MKKSFILLALSLAAMTSLALETQFLDYGGYRIGNSPVMSDAVRIFKSDDNKLSGNDSVTDSSLDDGLSLVASRENGQKVVRWWSYNEATSTPPDYNGVITITNGTYAFLWRYGTVSYDWARVVVDYDYIKYKLSYDANGGSGVPLAVNNIIYTNEVSIASGNSVSRPGYTFNGWTNDLTTTVWTNGEIVTGSSLGLNSIVDGSNVVLRAKWTANDYTVKFNANGGTGSMSDQSFTYDQTQSLTSNAFVRAGYMFNGWAKSPDGSKQYDNGQTVSNLTSENGAEVTLYAKWSLVYYSLATSTTGTGSGTVSLSPSGGSYTNGVVVQVTANPASGSTFIQWSDGVTDNPRTYTMTSNISVSAVFAISTYTVTFKDYDDTTLLFQNCNHGDAMPHPSPDPSREGYVFKGWLPDPPDTVTRTAVYTAQYEAKSYTVRFHSNYGNGATESTKEQAFTYGTSQNLSSVSSLKFAKDGYTFAHWKEREGGQKYEDGEQVLNLADHGVVHFDAQWTPNTYTVQFDANDGTGEMADMHLVYDVETNLTANGFSRTGYAFSGWATSNSADVKYADGAVVSNLTATANGTYALYAKWTANSYTVMLDRGGGTGGTGSTNVIFGSAMPNIAVPTRTGYKFGGYFTEPNGGGVQYYTQNGKSARHWDIASDTTLYAKWTANDYKVAFYGNGGYGSMPNQDFTYDVAQGLASNCFVKAGYSFGGWSTNSSSAAIYTDEAVVSNLTATAGGWVYLYANWAANSYKVTFDANGGGVSPESKSVTYDATYGELPEPTRMGYVFDGWYTSASGGSKVTAETKVLITAEQTLYAQWSANHFAVSFDANGGTGSMLDQSFTYDEEKNLTSNSFVKTGYSFGGWATAPALASEYGDGQLVSNLTATAGGTVTLYATWTPIAYTISFRGNGADSGSVGDIEAAYDIEYPLPDNGFAKAGRSFRAWQLGLDGDTYKVGDSVSNLTTTAGATVAFYAVWSEPRYVAFNGNGADNLNSMTGDVMVFEGAEAKMLVANKFEKTGYTFSGWATNETDAASLATTYGDGVEVAGTELNAPIGETNTFYAVWDTNVYTVVFHANGGAGSMDPMTIYYDQETNLSAVAFSSPNESLWVFDHWSNDVDGVAFSYTNRAVVLNLATEDGATVDLYAIWRSKLSDLSKAMHCDNLVWESTPNQGHPQWEIAEGAGEGYNPSGSSVFNQVDWQVRQSQTLQPIVSSGAGKLSFMYKMAGDIDDSWLKFMSSDTEIEIDCSAEWKKFGPIDVSDISTVQIFFNCNGDADPCTVWIDQMTWVPDSVEPTDEDSPTISGFTKTTDGFALTVDQTNISDSFSYQILATNELVNGDWPVKETLTADELKAGYEIVIEENEPKMFYKVKVISK